MTNPTTMTPRTDAVQENFISEFESAGYPEDRHFTNAQLDRALQFARQLETELNAAREENEKLHVYNDRQLGELMEAVSRARVAESSLATSQENERLLQKACDDLEDTIKQQEASLEKVREEMIELCNLIKEGGTIGECKQEVISARPVPVREEVIEIDEYGKVTNAPSRINIPRKTLQEIIAALYRKDNADSHELAAELQAMHDAATGGKHE